MPTLRDRATRAAIAARLDRLSPDAAARWGTMTAPRMLAHLNDAFEMAFGERAVTPKNLPLARTWLMKWLIFHVLPFPRNAPSAREICTREPESFDAERARLKAAMQRMDPGAPASTYASHPIFGRLTADEWGTLGWKHADHHLRQFGV